MKSRLLWFAVIVTVAAGFYYTTIRPMLTPAQPRLNRRINEDFRPLAIPPPPLPEPKIEVPTVPLPPPGTVRPLPAVAAPAANAGLEVPIQDGATIDFSIGAPVVRSQGADQAALEKALKEMAEATKDARFEAPPAPAPGGAGGARQEARGERKP